MFKDKYTTDALILADSSKDKVEKKKVVLSNDAFAIGEMIELLINTWRNK